MKKQFSQLFGFGFLLALPLLMISCGGDDETKPAPQVTTDRSTLNLTPGEQTTITANMVVPGKLATVAATADKGVASVGTITGKGTTSGTTEITYTAPDEAGSYQITITASDEASQSGKATVDVTVTDKPPVDLAAGEITGTLEKNTTYVAAGSLIVPAGKSLTIEEGVTIIFDGDGSQGAPELTVYGSLYSYGTEARPNYFTVPEAKRTKANIFAGLWGGIQATISAENVVLEYSNIEFAGAPAGAGNPSVDAGVYEDGDARYGLLFTNTDGKFVMSHSRIAYTSDDGMRVIGGTILIMYNTYELTGKTGGESLNIKSSVTGDVAYNISYKAATNAYKWSNKSGSKATPQTDIRVYNNTAIDGGWRQTKTGRGGSINAEEGARGLAYNNLMVNCRFGVRIVESADVDNLLDGYNFNFGSEQVIVTEFYPSAGIIAAGDKETSKDVNGTVGTNDPLFANYKVSDFVSDNVKDPAALDFMDSAVDFHLKTGSPAIGKGKTGFATKNTTLTVNGKTYTVPAPSDFIGALGTN